MGDVAIRVATVDDLDALRDVYRRASMSNERDRPLLEAHPDWLELDPRPVVDGRTIAGTDDGVVVAFATVTIDPPVVELDALFTDPDHRRAGHARRLIDAVVARGRAAGAGRVEVTANLHAHAFYVAAGFVVVGTADTAGGPAPRMRLAL